MSQAHILVVDDEPDIRQLMRDILEDEGYAVETAGNGEAARAAFTSQTPDLVLLDIWMPDVDGISLLREWSESGRLDCPVVMISGHGTLETAVEATRLGAHDFIQKPLSLDKLLATVKQALGSHGKSARRSGAATPEPLSDPQGSSPQMRLLRQRAEQAASHGPAVLISGEPGSGKEAVAAYIHRRGNAAGPFVLLDAVRMGGERAVAYLVGALTGEGHQPGALDNAANGTLFIPEVQNLDQAAQLLLGSVLENRSYIAEGDTQPRPLACRIIASLSSRSDQPQRDAAINERLMLHLNVLNLSVPTLRERPEDIPELVSFYVDWFANHEGLPWRSFPVSVLNRLRNCDWPGNERELRNLVQRLLILGAEGDVTVQEIDEALRQPAAGPATDGLAEQRAFDLPLREARELFEREYLVYQLRKAGGSVGRLAESVGMERTHLYRKLRSLGIDPKSIGGGQN
jgi:DNA-binding NtrC family response regulator